MPSSVNCHSFVVHFVIGISVIETDASGSEGWTNRVWRRLIRHRSVSSGK
jgi:hypothetical protein